MRILVIGGISRSLVNFRGKMLEAMVQAGHEVYACAGEVEPDAVEMLKAMGVTFEPVDLVRRGTSILSDRRYFLALKEIIGKISPDVVMGYTIKPIVYGCRAAHEVGVPMVTAMVTGAGAAQPGTNLKEKMVSQIARRLYRRAFRSIDLVFFQNSDDEAMFRDAGLLGQARVAHIPGSGVDLTQFQPTATVTEPITFLLIARLLINKGLREYASAAKLIKARWPEARVLLAGPEEHGAGGVPMGEVKSWEQQGILTYLGSLSDVRPALADSSVYVLPSYREGTPRTVLEAMAMGRPIITSDAPGCRETVEPDVNGFLVPVRDPEALANAMGRFLEHPGLIDQMGRASLDRAQAIYDVNRVNRIILKTLGMIDSEAADD